MPPPILGGNAKEAFATSWGVCLTSQSSPSAWGSLVVSHTRVSVGVVVGFLLASELLVLFSEHQLSSSGGGKGAREGHGGEEVQSASRLSPRMS